MRALWLLPLLLPVQAAAVDRALSFDGSDDRAGFGPFDPGSAFTVELWVRLNEPGRGLQTIIEALPVTEQNSLYIGWTGSSWQIEIEDIDNSEGTSCTQNFDVMCPSATLPNNARRHLALVIQTGLASFYVDGVLASQRPLSRQPTNLGTDAWQLGMDDIYSPNDPLYGLIDEVRIWKRARSAADIQCTMGYALTGGEASLGLRFAMDENPNASTFPSSGPTPVLTAVFNGASFASSPFGLVQSAGGDIPCFDFDGDGFSPNQGDCNDRDPEIRPNRAESWYDGIDQNCDGKDDYDKDGDGSRGQLPDGSPGPDCDDNNPARHPGATELWYNDVDENCDGNDADYDGDGYDGCPAGQTCADCADRNPSVNPGATEVWYNGIDEDCDGNDADADGDGFDGGPSGDDCDDTDPLAYPGAPERLNGRDDDCDGWADGVDSDGDGLDDLAELAWGTDPLDPDSDHDGWDDRTEVGAGPAAADTDGDGTIDALDLDSDADGILDADEVDGDTDCDGLVERVDGQDDGLCAPVDTGAVDDTAGDDTGAVGPRGYEPTTVDVVPPGCGCASGPGPGTGWALALVGLLALRRRSR